VSSLTFNEQRIKNPKGKKGVRVVVTPHSFYLDYKQTNKTKICWIFTSSVFHLSFFTLTTGLCLITSTVRKYGSSACLICASRNK